MEEAFKMRNLLQEFLKIHDGVRYPSILGVREHIFTGRYSCLLYIFYSGNGIIILLGTLSCIASE
jgi:callose synthase